MQLTRYTPFSELTSLQGAMNRLWRHAFSPAWGDEGVDTISTLVPPVDIHETADSLEFYAELPGFEKDQIDIRVDQGNLILSGERKFEEDVKEEDFHRIERSYGKFQRTFSLPPSVDAGKIKATLKNGVLHITLPKAEAAKPRQVPVSVS
ncbi:MAG: Hsp20/alpha crystallin family protein [Acidobacteria bacterium]|nr:Hsp20/alpha crystallin family protein [Acidobacteriota bacterium]